MTYNEVRPYVHSVKPYKWLLKNLTVVAMGSVGMYDVMFVSEKGYNGEKINESTMVFTEVKNVSQ